MPRVTLELRKIVLAHAAARAEEAGIPLARWCAQAVEAVVVESRCSAHHSAPPAPPTPAPDVEARE